MVGVDLRESGRRGSRGNGCRLVFRGVVSWKRKWENGYRAMGEIRVVGGNNFVKRGSC